MASTLLSWSSLQHQQHSCPLARRVCMRAIVHGTHPGRGRRPRASGLLTPATRRRRCSDRGSQGYLSSMVTEMTLLRTNPTSFDASRRVVLFQNRSLSGSISPMGNSSIRRRYHSTLSYEMTESAPSILHSSPPSLLSSSSSNMGAAIPPGVTTTPSWPELRTLFVASAIPMVGFGFMDNIVMIQAGQYIDSTLGVTLGLATLTAAAAGQVVSDVSGVLFGGTLERFLTRFSLLEAPTLTAAQRQLPICRNVSMAGAVLGVICGCALGATSLLFMDLEARERTQRALLLREILSDMITTTTTTTTFTADDHAEADSEGASLFHCESANLFLASADDFSLDEGKIDRATNSKYWRTHLALIKKDGDAAQDVAVRQCAATRQVGVEPGRQRLYVPVVKDQELIAVVEFLYPQPQNNTTSAPTTKGFTDPDVRTAQIMARHLAIMMDHLSE